MKKKLLITVFFIGIGVHMYAQNVGIINDFQVRMRSEPNLQSTTLGYVSTNDKVTILAKSEKMLQIDTMYDYWYKVRTEKGLEGWVYGHFINIAEVKQAIVELNSDDFGLINPQGEHFILFANAFDIKSLDTSKGETIYTSPYGSWIQMETNDINITWTDEGYILHLITESTTYKTKRGIRVGSTVEQVFETYGTGYAHSDKISYNLGSAEHETVLALIFYVKNNVVHKIELLQGT